VTRVAGPMFAACEDLIKLYVLENNNRQGYLERVTFHVDVESWQAILALEDMGMRSAISMFGRGLASWANVPVKTVHTKNLSSDMSAIPKGYGPISKHTTIEDNGMPQMLTLECIDQRTKRVVYINHPHNPPEYQ